MAGGLFKLGMVRMLMWIGVTWFASLIYLAVTDDFEIWILPEPGHGEPWLKQKASPIGQTASLLFVGCGGLGLAVVLCYAFHHLVTRLRLTRFQVAGALLLIAGCATGFAVIWNQAHRIQPTPERVQLAEACLALSRSIGDSNEQILKRGDPRIPQALLRVDPSQVIVTPSNVIIWVSGPFREYHLKQIKETPNTWLLYAALAHNGKHKEVLRITQ
jgi:hypothetical protein